MVELYRNKQFVLRSCKVVAKCSESGPPCLPISLQNGYMEVSKYGFVARRSQRGFFGPKWSQSGRKVVARCSLSSRKLVLKWSQNSRKVVAKWSQSDREVVAKWSQSGRKVVVSGYDHLRSGL